MEESKIMEEKDLKVWLKQFKENYSGKSVEAKEIEGFLLSTYNGASYVPWATMERLTYMQDPNAKFELIPSMFGGIVHTDEFVNHNKSVAKDGTCVETTASAVSHFIRISCTFLGKTIIEDYAIQDQDYSALKVYNQNAVNKAIKRGMAKVASRVTGLGLKLYEQKDLQFDEKIEETKSVVKKVKETKVEPMIEVANEVVEELPTNQTGDETTNVETQQENKVSYSDDVYNLCILIKNTDKDKMTKVLQSLNTAILKQHGFTLDIDDNDDELCEKINHFKDVKVFTRAITNMLGE